ncbi:MAG: zinc ribbon domain-containing protein, partial [Promethearchaeota archaeon]
LKDYQHWLSKQIVENTKANTLIIGDLAVKEMAKKKKGTGNARKTKAQKTLHHSVQNTGFMSRFAQFLTYKAERLGKRVIRIGEEKTTKACCNCGKLSKRTIYERFINERVRRV